MKKMLILNGSPHSNGNTAYIIEKLKERINNKIEICELNAYKSNIKPCIGCKYCWKNEGCSIINDDMKIIWEDDYDIIVVASPVYMYNVTPPLFSIITRLNMKWCNKYFLKKEYNSKNKKGILILTGGGSGKPDNAIDSAEIVFKILNAEFNINNNYIYSLNTNTIPAKDDKNLIELIDKTIESLNI